MLTIGALRGEFDGMLKEHTFKIVWIMPEKPRGMGFEGETDEAVR